MNRSQAIQMARDFAASAVAEIGAPGVPDSYESNHERLADEIRGAGGDRALVGEALAIFDEEFNALFPEGE